ncbi:PhnE/PtxC family ABC transporter permease [[Mycoplasma] testudinis]|uniref:PhnE/PtxC family ABC transporter permease n=1 Tax=[Mycoplasma] testudinis TaxID=33924 RepID=UPI00048599EE|nr:ABC transporter permease subunit [[Mycoplasma] testudinis]
MNKIYKVKRKQSNWFFNWYVNSDNQITKKQLRIEWKVFILIVVLSISIYLLIFSSYTYTNNGFFFFNQKLKELFGFNQNSSLGFGRNLVTTSFNLLWQTIKITVTGTVFGVGLALLSAYFAAKRLKNFWYGLPIRLGVLFLRAFPTIIFTLLFTRSYSADLSGILIMFWFTWLWLHKYYVEIFENLDLSFYYAQKAAGHNFFLAFKNEVYFRIKDRIISLFFYSFESNIRWVSLLAAVGVPGIGQLVYIPVSTGLVSWDQVSIPLFILIGFSLLLEFFSVILNKYLLVQPSKRIGNKRLYFQQFRWRNFVLYFIALLFLIILIYELVTTQFRIDPTTSFANAFSSLFVLNWVQAYSWNNASAVFQVFIVFQQALSIILFVSIFGFVFAVLQNEKINNIIFSFFIKTCLTILRVLPSILFFRLINFIVVNPVSAVIITLTITSIASVSKQMSLAINTMDFSVYHQYKLERKNYLWIVINYIYPAIQKDRISLLSFEFENILRDVIFFGIFGSSALGNTIQVLFDRRLYADVANYMWPAVFLIIVVDLSSAAVREWDLNNFLDKLKTVKDNLKNKWNLCRLNKKGKE